MRVVKMQRDGEVAMKEYLERMEVGRGWNAYGRIGLSKTIDNCWMADIHRQRISEALHLRHQRFSRRMRPVNKVTSPGRWACSWRSEQTSLQDQSMASFSKPQEKGRIHR